MIEFVLPQTLGEWLAWLTALATVIVGVAVMIAPRLFVKALGMETLEGRKEGLSEFRGPFGGFYVGIGLAVLVLHPQPLLYLALGAGFVFALAGRLISFVFDGARRGLVIPGTLAEVLGAFFPLAYAFGWIA